MTVTLGTKHRLKEAAYLSKQHSGGGLTPVSRINSVGVRPEDMRILILFLLSFCVLLFCGTGRAEVEARLPGAQVTIDKAIRFSRTDLVAEAELLGLGFPDPPRMPGVLTYETARFRIIRTLKGYAKGNVDKRLDLEQMPPDGPERVKEQTRYIIICASILEDGRSCAFKLLPDDDQNRKEVGAAITRLTLAPPVLLHKAEHTIQEDKELEEALALNEIGLIAVVDIVKIGNNFPPDHDSHYSFEGDFRILKALNGKERELIGKVLPMIGPRMELPAGTKATGKYIVVCGSSDGHIIKMFRHNKKTERAVVAAIAAVKKYPTNP